MVLDEVPVGRRPRRPQRDPFSGRARDASHYSRRTLDAHPRVAHDSAPPLGRRAVLGDWPRLAIIVLCLFGAVLASALLAYLHGILFAWLDGNIGHYLRRGIFAQLLSVNFGFIERDRSGRLLHVLGTDTWRTNDALKMLICVI